MNRRPLPPSSGLRHGLGDDECERLVARYMPLVCAIARSLLRRLPASVEEDDLVQDGCVGLLVAIVQNTAAQAGQRYTAYLSRRIRGAMLDGLREIDPATRKVRQEMRRFEQANPLAALERKGVQMSLLQAISELDEKEETVIRGAFEDMPAHEIASRIGVSEGRVSQLRTQAIAKLRAALLGDDSRPSLLRPRWRTS